MAEKKLPKGITLRKDGIYVGRFTFRGERKVFYDTDIKKLEKKMSDAKYEMEHGIYRRPEKMTYEEWFQIWINVNFQKKEIYVVGTLKYSRTEKRYYIDLPKTKTSLRTIPMAEKVCGIMKQVKKLQLEQKMKLGELWRQKKEFEDLVFTNEVGDIISHDCLNVNVKKIVKQINRDIEKEAKENHQQSGYFRSLTPHTLRYSFATNMIALGMEPKTLSTILGHATLAQTMDLYVHISNEMRRTELEKAYKKMEDMELVQ